MSDFQPHLIVATVIQKDDLFLMVEEYSGGKRVINQPAGHVEPDESLIAAAIRETLEETGWHCDIKHLIHISKWIHPRSGDTHFRITFSADAIRYDDTQPLDDSIIQALWLSYDEIASRANSHRSPSVMRGIDDYVAGKHYPLDMIINF